MRFSAASSAYLRAATVDRCAAMLPGLDLSRFIVGSETEEALAKSRCSERRRAVTRPISNQFIAFSVGNRQTRAVFSRPIATILPVRA